MNKEVKKKIESLVQKFPSTKTLIGLAISIILAAIVYLSILFLLSN
ncbi:MAG: hypothetical protein PHP96_02570 [Candidatus Dojkabacteria bacterium]|jgi:hypothetical protein|nr:hypothetical protein [Candidatus Dojkabacteria bacterium]MDD4561213.1 hypothetical protein [Candidatus Dojkabacteria bacterium]NLB12159.1 hypothetical protein [Candidatus Dojkabacteria bacterium]